LANIRGNLWESENAANQIDRLGIFANFRAGAG
jgi:hypothetical protein